MVWCQTNDKRFPEPIVSYRQLDPWEQISHKNFNQNISISIQENALENVFCNIAAILSQPQYDKAPQ